MTYEQYKAAFGKSYYSYVYDQVFGSSEYSGASKIVKVKAIAQYVYAHDRTQEKEDCVWQALEWYEDMTGCWFDPTHEEFDEIVYSII